MKALNAQSVQLRPSPFISLISATDWKAKILKPTTAAHTVSRTLTSQAY